MPFPIRESEMSMEVTVVCAYVRRWAAEGAWVLSLETMVKPNIQLGSVHWDSSDRQLSY